MKQRDPTVILTNLGQLCSPSKGALYDAKTITLFFIMHETMKRQVMFTLTHGVFITAFCTDANNMIQGIVKKQKTETKTKSTTMNPCAYLHEEKPGTMTLTDN